MKHKLVPFAPARLPIRLYIEETQRLFEQNIDCVMVSPVILVRTRQQYWYVILAALYDGPEPYLCQIGRGDEAEGRLLGGFETLPERFADPIVALAGGIREVKLRSRQPLARHNPSPMPLRREEV